MALVQFFRGFFAPPSFDGDEVKTRRARLLTLTLNIVILGMPVVIVGNLLGGRTPALVQGLNVVIAVSCLALRHWLHRGEVQRVATLYVVSLSVFITISVAALGTIRTPTSASYILLVVVAGLLFDWRGLMQTVVLNSIAVAMLIVAENAGWLPPPDLTVTITQWVTYTAMLALAGGLTYFALLEIRQALHRADQALAERVRAETTLRAITDNLYDMVALLDLQAGIRFASPSFERRLGYQPAGLIGRSGFEFIHPDDRPAVQATLQSALQDPTYYRVIEFRGCHIDGQYRLLEATGQFLRSADQITGLVITLRDITERRQTEMQLRQLSRAVDAAPVSIIITDVDGDIEYVNPKFTDLTGYTFAEVCGHNPRILQSGETPRATYEDLWTLIMNGGTWRGEFRNKKKHGELYWGSAIISPISDPASGRITHFVGVEENITDRKQLEALLQRRNAALEGLYQITLDILKHRSVDEVFHTLAQRAASLLDAPFCEIMVLEGDELVVRACTPNQDFTLGDRTRQDQARLSWQAVITREPTGMDDYSSWEHHRAVYDRLELRAVASIPIISGDRCLGVLDLSRTQPGYVFDAEQLQTGKLLAQLAALVLDNAQLYAAAQSELAERTQAEVLLRQSNAELHTRNEELDAFAHTVAHDLKSPLGTVVGFAELISEDSGNYTPEALRQALSGLMRSARKAGNIVEALLVLASVRQQDIIAAPLEMGYILDEVMARLEESIQDTGAIIQRPDRTSWPRALGHAPWIEEVWFNYLSNAIKYGGRPPRIELSAQPQADGFIRFEVRDHGAGLTPEQLARLFAPFERLGQSRVRGHGLGLSIVRRIIEKLGGQVGVESEPGQGSTFYFTLPAATKGALRYIV
ncbi:MAG: PAS domain S-box protein [Anaerolineae bacterium]